MIALRLPPFLLLLLLGACAAPSAPLPPRAPEPAVELADVRALLWQGREDEALEWLEGMAWRHSGSVAAERLRQDLRVARGERAELAAELEDLAEQGPDPDLTYLRARLHGDPVRRLAALEEGARRHPTHPWLALGAAATHQEFGDWEDAEAWLDEAPADPASAPFRRLLIARQQATAGRHFSAWRTLERDAFESGSREALAECIRIAQALDSDRRLARAQTEFALRSAPAAGDVGAAMDRVLERLIAEEPWMRDADLAQTLALMDAWAELAGVPTGWSAQPRYTVAGIAELVQPESFRGGVAKAWMQHGRFLLIGRAPGRGVDWVLLQDAHCVALPEEGGFPVEMIVARRGLEPADRTIPGGAPFHGFFLRLDLVEAGASLRSAELARFAAGGPADRLGEAPGGGAGVRTGAAHSRRGSARILGSGAAPARPPPGRRRRLDPRPRAGAAPDARGVPPARDAAVGARRGADPRPGPLRVALDAQVRRSHSVPRGARATASARRRRRDRVGLCRTARSRHDAARSLLRALSLPTAGHGGGGAGRRLAGTRGLGSAAAGRHR